ncbi:MAG: response regulator [Verrucomicrobia bacterium]|nr:response regulator [Verrucomicrobiota bacterium]
MKKAIRILFVEDVARDVDLILAALRGGGLAFRFKRVQTRRRYVYESEHHPPDLILSDYGIPGLGGFTALAIARKKCPRVPVVLVSDQIGVGAIIDTLRSGATGCVLKRRLDVNLPHVVRRALSEADDNTTAPKSRWLNRASVVFWRPTLEIALATKTALTRCAISDRSGPQ